MADAIHFYLPGDEYGELSNFAPFPSLGELLMRVRDELRGR